MSKLITIKLSDYGIVVESDAENIQVSIDVHNVLTIESRREHKRLAMERYRHGLSEYQEGITEAFADVAHLDSVEEPAMRSMEIEQLHDALSELTPTERSRVNDYYFSNLTFQEIAKKEGVNYFAVHKSVSSAVEKLKRYFSVHGKG